jgi:hypothetical protein
MPTTHSSTSARALVIEALANQRANNIVSAKSTAVEHLKELFTQGLRGFDEMGDTELVRCCKEAGLDDLASLTDPLAELKAEPREEVSIVFLRYDRDETTNVATLHLRYQPADEDAPPTPIEAFERGITDWIVTTEAGRAAWNASCQDFNIGDYLHGEATPELKRCLEVHGVVVVRLDSPSMDQVQPYDRVLIDREHFASLTGGRKAEIEKRLAELGYRMDHSLSSFDGEGHCVIRIETEEELETPTGEVLDLATEWSILEGVVA